MAAERELEQTKPRKAPHLPKQMRKAACEAHIQQCPTRVRSVSQHLSKPEVSREVSSQQLLHRAYTLDLGKITSLAQDRNTQQTGMSLGLCCELLVDGHHWLLYTYQEPHEFCPSVFPAVSTAGNTVLYNEDTEAQKRETRPSRSPFRLLSSIVHAPQLLLVQK